jgi:MFS family permease
MKHTLLRIYAFRFATGFLPIMNLYTLIFLDDGFSTFEISALIATWSVASLVFEVPSGVLADKYDRRYVLCASQLLTAAAFGTWLTFPDFWGYFIGFVLWGIGGALDFGTYDAFVYDELAEQQSESTYADVLGRTEAVYLVAVVASFSVASLVVRDGFQLLLWISMGVAIAGSAIGLSLPKAARREAVEDAEYLSLLRRGVRSALRTPVLARAIALIAIAGCITDLVTEYFPVFATDRHVTPTGVAMVSAGSVLIMATSAAWATKMPGARLPPATHLAVAGLLVTVSTFLPVWPAVATFFLAAAVANASWVLTRAAMQEHVLPEVRATTTSVAGFSQEVLNVGGLLVIGTLADAFSRDAAFRAAGLAVLLVAMILAFFHKEPAQEPT